MKDLEVFFPGKKQIDVRVGKFLINTDQTCSSGGDESAPEPFDYFLASLAACAGIYALNFCHKRGISTKGLGLKLLCYNDPEKKLYDNMEFILKLPEDFPIKYRDAIVRSMQLCAVKRHMENMPNMSFKIEG